MSENGGWGWCGKRHLLKQSKRSNKNKRIRISRIRGKEEVWKSELPLEGRESNACRCSTTDYGNYLGYMGLDGLGSTRVSQGLIENAPNIELFVSLPHAFLHKMRN